MPNPEHLDILKQGVATWNKWRKDSADSQDVRPNLREADLGGANLHKANFLRANLGGANLREADLREASMQHAYLRKADLSGARLAGANLIGANLRETNLVKANLIRADLRDADLRKAIQLAPESFEPVNDLAFTLATAKDDSIRDGAKAIALAERANTMTDEEHWNALDTLAVARAAVNDFDGAHKVLTRAIELAPERQQAKLKAHQKLIAAGMPVRE